VAGAGHSFSRWVETDGVIVSLDRLQGLIDSRRPGHRARVQPARGWALAAALAERGLAMENLGDINVQSIAGATSTAPTAPESARQQATQIAALKCS
jgi:L-gulonolactone oxidase